MTDNQNETPTAVAGLGLSPRAVDEIERTFNSLTLGYATAGEYIAHHFPGEEVWRGDACGCTDDRCIGYHHTGSRCGCLDVQLDQFHDDLVAAHTIRKWLATRTDQDLVIGALDVLYAWSRDIGSRDDLEARLTAEQNAALAEMFASGVSTLTRSDYITAVNRVGVDVLKPSTDAPENEGE